MKTAVIYARYSSDKQTEQSIEGQLRVCYDYAERNNISIVGTYIDRAISGKTDNRAEFQRMLRDSHKQAWNNVLVYKLDRFSRNKYEMAIHKRTLRDNGAKVISATENIPDTPEGIILESLLEGMAEYYSAELAQKVKRGMKESRNKGQFTGGCVGYGYKVEDKKVLIDENQAEIVKEIFTKFAEGIYVKDIITDLTQRGIYNRGKPFVANTIYKMLKNQNYYGRHIHDSEVFINIYPRIIPDELEELVSKRVELNRYGKHVPIDYLLKGKAKCGYCGHTFMSETGTSKNGSVMRYYKCLGRKKKLNTCDNVIMRKDTLEQLVVDTILKVFANSESIFQIADMVLKRHNELSEDNSTLNLLNKEKESTQKAINNIMDFIERGVATETTSKRLLELEEKLANIENGLAVEQHKQALPLKISDVVKFIKQAIKKKPKLMIKALVKEVLVFKDKIEIYFNYIDKNKCPDDEHQAFLIYQNNETYQINEHRINQSIKEVDIKMLGYI